MSKQEVHFGPYVLLYYDGVRKEVTKRTLEVGYAWTKTDRGWVRHHNRRKQ